MADAEETEVVITTAVKAAADEATEDVYTATLSAAAGEATEVVNTTAVNVKTDVEKKSNLKTPESKKRKLSVVISEEKPMTKEFEIEDGNRSEYVFNIAACLSDVFFVYDV